MIEIENMNEWYGVHHSEHNLMLNCDFAIIHISPIG